MSAAVLSTNMLGLNGQVVLTGFVILLTIITAPPPTLAIALVPRVRIPVGIPVVWRLALRLLTNRLQLTIFR